MCYFDMYKFFFFPLCTFFDIKVSNGQKSHKSHVEGKTLNFIWSLLVWRSPWLETLNLIIHGLVQVSIYASNWANGRHFLSWHLEWISNNSWQKYCLRGQKMFEKKVHSHKMPQASSRFNSSWTPQIMLDFYTFAGPWMISVSQPFVKWD